ncbi:MAG: DUF389 domain-containing protein [Blastomonas sp.]
MSAVGGDSGKAIPKSGASSFAEVVAALRHWWANTTRDIDHLAVIEKVRAESGFTPRYVFMICMSAGIAILGLLLSSPAVVIGAMLLSPLMGPIIGVGFALAIGDYTWLKEAGRALGYGSLLAILFCAFVVLLSPLDTVTPEIAARTRPNLFDLAVALFSALAGAYAMIRGREGTIVGVAIATALMPPLAVVGFGLATMNGTVFGGALVLFFTNLMTIALTATMMARINGFRSKLSPQQTTLQNIVVGVVFFALAVPLGFSLQQIAWEANATRKATSVVRDQFDDKARVSAIDFDFAADPIRVNASVLTPNFKDDAEALTRRILTSELGRPIEVTINQYRVGTGSGEAESAQLAAARASEQASLEENRIVDLADRMALIAGVGPESVVVDRAARRAFVKARPLPGAGLETYFTLEERVARLQPDWVLEVRPPAASLPAIELKGDAPDDDGATALDLAAWASKRLDSPLGVVGEGRAPDIVRAELRKRGVSVATAPGRNGNAVRLVWLPPDQAPAEPEGAGADSP